MKTLKVIRDSDIGSDEAAPQEYKERKAARAVVFDEEGKVAIFHSTKNHYHKLPGGGVEEGEDIETGLRRELVEEIGCEVEDIKELGVIEEYRNKLKVYQVNYGFTAKVRGEKGNPHLEQGEIDDGFVTEWIDLGTAIETLEKDKNSDLYEAKYMVTRDLTFLKEAKRST